MENLKSIRPSSFIPTQNQCLVAVNRLIHLIAMISHLVHVAAETEQRKCGIFQDQ